jgi:hypothetical protein
VQQTSFTINVDTSAQTSSQFSVLIDSEQTVLGADLMQNERRFNMQPWPPFHLDTAVQGVPLLSRVPLGIVSVMSWLLSKHLEAHDLQQMLPTERFCSVTPSQAAVQFMQSSDVDDAMQK